jgi:hypothetical protein
MDRAPATSGEVRWHAGLPSQGDQGTGDCWQSHLADCLAAHGVEFQGIQLGDWSVEDVLGGLPLDHDGGGAQVVIVAVGPPEGPHLNGHGAVGVGGIRRIFEPLLAAS